MIHINRMNKQTTWRKSCDHAAFLLSDAAPAVCPAAQQWTPPCSWARTAGPCRTAPGWLQQAACPQPGPAAASQAAWTSGASGWRCMRCCWSWRPLSFLIWGLRCYQTELTPTARPCKQITSWGKSPAEEIISWWKSPMAGDYQLREITNGGRLQVEGNH